MERSKRSSETVHSLLASYPPRIQTLALQTRKLITDSLPNAEETVDPTSGMIAYGFGSGYAGLICTIIPSKSGVNLGFYRGADLPDPKGLLKGRGRVHRHVHLTDLADLEDPGLKQLLKAAHDSWKRRMRLAGGV